MNKNYPNRKNIFYINPSKESKTNFSNEKLSFELFSKYSKNQINKISSTINIKEEDQKEEIIKTNNNKIFNSEDFLNKSMEISIKENRQYSPYVIKMGNVVNNDNNILNSSINEIKFKKCNKLYSPFPKRKILEEKLSDRFIPVNEGLDITEKYELTNIDDINQLKIKKKINNDKISILNKILLNNIKNISNFHKNIPNYSINKNINDIIKERILSFKTKRNDIFDYESNNIKSISIAKPRNQNKINFTRKINNIPYKIIEIDNLIDDYYLNVLDWSSKNIVAVGCKNSIFLWNYEKSHFEIIKCSIDESILQENNKIISSLIFHPSGERIAVGNSLGSLAIYDIETKKLISVFSEHKSRIGALSWYENILSSGSKDSSIINRDIRCDKNNIINKFKKHKEEVCGLKWSFDGKKLASGGNDNYLYIWDIKSEKPIMEKRDHIAAVKAIAWSPIRYGILATGGGTTDKKINLWNTNTGEQIFQHDTESQVCNLIFSKKSDELVSTHGFSNNHINIWKIPNMEKVGSLIGHDYRVLFLALSPDGQNTDSNCPAPISIIK